MKVFIVGLVMAGALATAQMPEALAVKTAIEASGNVQMNAALNEYQNNVLQAVTRQCLAKNAAKETVVSLTVDAHGHIMRVVLANSGLKSEAIVDVLTALKALNLGDAGASQSDTLRITFDFDLAEVLAGAKSTGTSISIRGGSITGDGTQTGGIRIGGGGAITAGGGALSVPGTTIVDLAARRRDIDRTPALIRLAELEKAADGNPQGLCDARILAATEYWQVEDFDKAREMIGKALKFLEGPAGPISRQTSRQLDRLAQQVLYSQTSSDEDLVWRMYAAIEKKAAGGCSDNELANLVRTRPAQGKAKSGDQVASLLNRILELREMREGTSSIKLLPVLTNLATADENVQRHDAAVHVQERIARIQQQNAVPPPAGAANQ